MIARARRRLIALARLGARCLACGVDCHVDVSGNAEMTLGAAGPTACVTLEL